MDSIQTENEFLWGGLLIPSFSTLLMMLSLTALMWDDCCYWWRGGVWHAITGAFNAIHAAGLDPVMHSDIWGAKCVWEGRLRGATRQCFSCEQSQCNALLGITTGRRTPKVMIPQGEDNNKVETQSSTRKVGLSCWLNAGREKYLKHFHAFSCSWN